MTDVFTLIAIPFGGVVGLIICSFIFVIEKISYKGFALSGLSLSLSMFILYIASVAGSNVVTNPELQSEMQGVASSLQWCGFMCLIFTVFIFIMSLYIYIFVENKKEVRGSKPIGSKK